MKERPILFSGPMVRAILDGRKTQTRRPYNPKAGFPREDGEVTPTTADAWTDYGPCPIGQPGDRLWVRETWTTTQYGKPVYRADSRDRDGYFWPSVANDPKGVLWKPSIHMPRWASRITLEIVRVSVERVQDITEEGARAEGVTIGEDRSHSFAEHGLPYRPHADAFHDLWQSIYGTWDANPWVWAVEFRRVKP